MKKNWNVAKIFTLLITVLFLASTLFVGCKEQEPEPEPEPSPVMYTVTYAVEGGGDSVTGLPETKTVEDGTVLKAADLPTLTAPEGWSFEGWYIGEEPFTSDYTVKSNITITAKFVENVAPSLPADPENPVEPEDPADPETPVDPEDPADPETPVDPETPADPEDPNKPEDPVTYIVVYNGVQIATLTEEEYIEYGNMLTATEDYTYNAETKTITLTDAGYAKVMGGEEEPEVPEQPVTYTVTYTVEGIDANLVEDLPESGTVNEDTVISLPSLVSPTGYVFDGWFINDELVSQHTVVAAVTIVAKFSEIVPVGTTYTIPDINAEWTNIVVWAWSDEVVGIVVAATNNAGVVTFVSDVEYTGCLVINLKDDNSIEEGATVFPDDAVVANKSTNYELGENNTYKEEEVVLSETKIYLAPNSNWKSDGARFAAYFFDNGETWVDMTDSDGDGIYECSVPEGFPSVIFCRMNSGTTENNWNNKWNQTGNLTVPTDGKNLFTVPDTEWDNFTGSWSTKE